MNQLSSPVKPNGSNPSIPKVDGQKSPSSKTQPDQTEPVTDKPPKASSDSKEKTIKDQKDESLAKTVSSSSKVPVSEGNEKERPQSPKIPMQQQLDEWTMTKSQDNSLTEALSGTAVQDKEEQKTQTDDKDQKKKSLDSKTEGAKKDSKKKYHQDVDFKKIYENAEDNWKLRPKEEIQFFYHNRKPEDKNHPSVYFRFDEEKKIIALAARSKDEGYSAITGVSPLNNYEEFKGVFLCATLFRKGLPDRSPYGSLRYILNAKDLIMDDQNELKALYLAGCYRMYKGSPTYIILVLADKKILFGEEDFKKLNFEENPFLTYKNGKLECLENSQDFPVYVEIFHVGDIPLRDGKHSIDDKVTDTGRAK